MHTAAIHLGSTHRILICDDSICQWLPPGRQNKSQPLVLICVFLQTLNMDCKLKYCLFKFCVNIDFCHELWYFFSFVSCKQELFIFSILLFWGNVNQHYQFILSPTVSEVSCSLIGMRLAWPDSGLENINIFLQTMCPVLTFGMFTLPLAFIIFFANKFIHTFNSEAMVLTQK